MRICFVAHPNHSNSRRWIRYFANDLGHEIHVIAVSPECEPIEGVTIHYIPVRMGHKWLYLLAIPRVRRLIKRLEPDILIGYRVQSNGFMAACAGFHPLVLAAQDEKIVTPPDSRVLRAIVKFTLRRGDWFNAWGPHMAHHMEALGAPRSRIIVRSRGVDLRVFRPLDPAQPSFKGDAPPTIVTTRGLYPIYRHDVLVAAMERVVEREPRARLVLVGEGPLEAEIRRDVERRGLAQHVRLVGQVEPHTVADLVRGAHVYTAVVETEGLSSSLIEAMACGTFPVVLDLEANRLLLEDGDNGLLVPAARPDLLGDRLLRALGDAELRRRAAAHNLEIVQRDHDWALNMRKMESEYLELLRSFHSASASRSAVSGPVARGEN